MKIREKKFLKKEPACLKQKYLKLFEALNNKSLALDERIIKSLGKRIGFQSSDQKVYKLISAYLEGEIEDILTSINHKNKKEIENITKKFKEAKEDTKMSKKKFANLHKMIMENRELTQKDLLVELMERDDFQFQPTVLPISSLQKDSSQIEEEGPEREDLEEKEMVEDN